MPQRHKGVNEAGGPENCGNLERHLLLWYQPTTVRAPYPPDCSCSPPLPSTEREWWCKATRCLALRDRSQAIYNHNPPTAI